MPHKGYKHTLETRAKMSAAQKGNKNALGYKHTPEACAKISEAQKGKMRPPMTTETRARMSTAHTGRKRPEISGANHPHWKGGRWLTTGGYISLLRHDHPLADSCGYVLEHRLVVEPSLGRTLLPSEVVHHTNGIKDDNRIENLEIMTVLEHNRLSARRSVEARQSARAK